VGKYVGGFGQKVSTFLTSNLNIKHRRDDVRCTSSKVLPRAGTHSVPYFFPELASAMAFTRSEVSFFNLRISCDLISGAQIRPRKGNTIII